MSLVLFQEGSIRLELPTYFILSFILKMYFRYFEV